MVDSFVGAVQARARSLTIRRNQLFPIGPVHRHHNLITTELARLAAVFCPRYSAFKPGGTTRHRELASNTSRIGILRSGTSGPVLRSFESPRMPAGARAFSEQVLASFHNVLRDNRFVPAAVNVS